MKKQKKVFWKIIGLLWIIALAFVGLKIYTIQKEYHQGVEEYDTLQEEWSGVLDWDLFLQSPETFASDQSLETLLSRYAAQNPDFVGIIYLPGTPIYYPVVQGTDNEYYLTHTYLHTTNPSGSIFLDSTADPWFRDPNTIVYGHNMHNGTMFEGLNLLLSPTVLETYHNVYLITPKDILIYEIFHVKETTVKDPLYQTEFVHGEDLSRYLHEIAPNKNFTLENKILTLSTCSYDVESEDRVVAQAVLTERFPLLPQR